MASGMKSFLLDCQDSDGLHSIIEVDYGIKGWAIIIKLFQRIHSTGGYYCNWNDRVARVFASDNAKVGAGVVQEVVAAALTEECGIFDKGMYEKYGILTSRECQLNWLQYARRHKVVFDRPEYVLIDCADFSGASETADNSGGIADNSVENVSDSGIKKVNKKKENIIKEKETGMALQAVPSSSPPSNVSEREVLVEKYGERAVSRYENKLRSWQERKGIPGDISYGRIAEWLTADKVPEVSCSSIDRDEITQELIQQYSG